MITAWTMVDGEGAAIVFVFGNLLWIIGAIALVLWMIFHQKEYSDNKDDESKKKEYFGMKHLLLCFCIAATVALLAVFSGH